MGDFYGYDPSRFVVPDRYGIGAASQAASKTVMNVSQAVSQKKEAEAKEKERQEKLRLAAEAVAKDKAGTRMAYDSVLKNYTRTVNSLVKEGVLTQEEADQKLGILYSLEPTDIALKNPMQYVTKLNEANISFLNDLGKIKKEFETQRNQGRVTGAVTQAMRGTPAIPGSPATPDQTVVNPETISAGVGRGALRAPMNAWGDAETTTIPGTPAIEPQAAIPPAQDKEETYLRTQEYLKNQKQPLATQTQLKEAGIENQRDRIAEEMDKEKLAFAKEKEVKNQALDQARLALAKSQNSRGIKEDQRKIQNATFNEITTELDKSTDNLAKTRSQLTTATNLKSKVKNIQNGELSPEVLEELKILGMDQNKAILNPSGIITDLEKNINALKITEKLQEKYNADFNKALLLWVVNPGDPLPRILQIAMQEKKSVPELLKQGQGEQGMSAPFSKQIQTRERPSGNLPSLTTEPGSTKKKQKIGQFIVEEE